MADSLSVHFGDISPLWRLVLPGLILEMHEAGLPQRAAWPLCAALVGLAQANPTAPASHRVTLDSFLAWGAQVFDELAPVVGQDALLEAGTRLLREVTGTNDKTVQEARKNSAGAGS